MSTDSDSIDDRIRAHAFNSLPFDRRLTSNLYLDHRIYKKGVVLGPAFQKIIVSRTSLLVFADDQPLANFGHDCRYLLYDPDNGELHAELHARFPPYLGKPPETLKPFHTPVRTAPIATNFRFPHIRRCPIFIPDGRRYAILYSGMSNMRHLNDLEFCYRMLVDRYAFRKQDIYALNYDGTLNTQDGLASAWPGDGTAYRIQVTGQGNRAAFQAAFNDLKSKLKSRDQLFIHTNNHGDNYGSGSFLCTYPAWGTYTATDFCNDLGTLPKYRSLVVMMEQCNAGGFNAPVVASSTAANTTIASAAIATQSSWASPDGHWDSFARDWIAAEIGHDPAGGTLAFNPDTNGDGVIAATEAFNYALAVKNPSDTPNYSQSSTGAGTLGVSQHYLLWWWWCWWWHWVIEPLLAKRYPGPPDPEYYQLIHRIAPELQKILVPAFDRAATGTQRKLASRIKATIAAELESRR